MFVKGQDHVYDFEIMIWNHVSDPGISNAPQAALSAHSGSALKKVITPGKTLKSPSFLEGVVLLQTGLRASLLDCVTSPTLWHMTGKSQQGNERSRKPVTMGRSLTKK